MKDEMTFIIIGGGDNSVGIPSSDWIATFKGNINWDKETIESAREMLKDFDDNGAKVYTEEEYDAELKREREAEHDELWEYCYREMHSEGEKATQALYSELKAIFLRMSKKTEASR